MAKDQSNHLVAGSLRNFSKDSCSLVPFPALSPGAGGSQVLVELMIRAAWDEHPRSILKLPTGLVSARLLK